MWNNDEIRENAQVGKYCILSKDVYIGHDFIIGSGVKVEAKPE